MGLYFDLVWPHIQIQILGSKNNIEKHTNYDQKSNGL
jgi:hypothetical protein